MATSTVIAGKALGDLLQSVVALADMEGHSLAAKAVPFRCAMLSVLQQADPSDPFGLVGAFLSQAEFAAFQELAPGQAAEVFAAQVHPGDLAANATAVDLFIHRERLERYKSEVALMLALQHCLHGAIPKHMQAAFISATTGVVRFGTPAQQWAKIMDLVGPLNHENIAQEAVALLAPYRPGTPLLEFFEVHDRSHRFRSTIGIGYTAYEKITLAYTALESCGLFTTTLRHYRVLYPNPGVDQTYERLKALMLVEGEMDISANKSTLSSAHAVTSMNQDLAELRAQVATLTAAIAAAKPAAAQTTLGPDRVITHFCWSCGRQTHHPSHKCPRPKAGHQNKAVRRDTMGSAHV